MKRIIHSIKFKITSLMMITIACLIVILLIFNALFSESSYMRGKQKLMISTFESINYVMNEYVDGKITDDELESQMELCSTGRAINVLVVDSSWSTIFLNTQGREMMLEKLCRSIFLGDNREDNHKREKIIIERNERYTLQKAYDDNMSDDFLEMWGTLDSGYTIIMSSPIQSIKDNVKISTRFIKIIGFIILIIGSVASFVVATLITKPIKQLSKISERMSDMDFDVKYTGTTMGEIGILGTNMNNMAEKLEDNISKLKSANIELKKDIDKREHLENMRSEFLSNVSHELKTPIALIQGYAEGLKEGISDDAESREYYLDVIMDEAEKMNAMVKRLLELNQLEFGNEELIMERFDINELVLGVIASNKIRAEQKNISVTFSSPEEKCYVWADEYKVETVVSNYITNAINHCSKDMSIKVSVLKDNDSVKVTVFNSGEHIPKQDIDRIWEKFYKVDKARTREYGGNGIGLSIVKAIMEALGKEYGVCNVDGGVEFFFYLDAK